MKPTDYHETVDLTSHIKCPRVKCKAYGEWDVCYSKLFSFCNILNNKAVNPLRGLDDLTEDKMKDNRSEQ